MAMGSRCLKARHGGVKFIKQICPTLRANKVCAAVILIEGDYEVARKDRRDVSAIRDDETIFKEED